MITTVYDPSTDKVCIKYIQIIQNYIRKCVNAKQNRLAKKKCRKSISNLIAIIVILFKQRKTLLKYFILIILRLLIDFKAKIISAYL